MKDIAISINNVSKQYRLGVMGTGTLSHDINRWWHLVRGMEDPYLKIGESNDRAKKGESDYVWALKDINFEVEKGDVLGVIGKNGAGKSTLLKLLSKVTTPTTGQIVMKGRVASLLEVGTGFHPELTGRENVYLNGAILGMTKKEISSKFDEIVDFSGCERYIDTPVKRYSSGMKVRLAFAVAAFLEPEILIVDEVLAVGDAEFQKKAIGKMQDVSQKGGRTVLFVSHNMGAIKMLCSKAILLQNGLLAGSGTPQEMINLYLSSQRLNEKSEWYLNENNSAINDNPYFKLTKFYLKDNDNNILKRNLHVDKDQVVKICVEGLLIKNDARLSFGIDVVNENSIHLICNKHLDLKEDEKINVKEGTLSLEALLDVSQFNEGKYYVGFNLSIWGIEMIYTFENTIATVSFSLDGLRGDPTKHRRKRNVVLAPYITWRVLNSHN
jgi:lipopolysaccharide transport system ATP-binding protein